MPPNKISGHSGPLSNVARHPECARIEVEIASKRSLKSIGDEFGLSKDSLARYWKTVPASRKAELLRGAVELGHLAKVAAQQDRSLLEWISIVRAEAWNLYRDTRERGLLLDANSALRTIMITLQRTAELTGQLRTSGLNITNISGGVTANTIIAGSSLEDFKERIRIAADRSNGADISAEAIEDAAEAPE